MCTKVVADEHDSSVMMIGNGIYMEGIITERQY